MAGFLILPLLLFGSVTLGNHTMLPADNLFQWAPWAGTAAAFNAEVPHNSLISDLIIQNYAWKRFILNSVQNGEIPLWNPYLFAGVPFLAVGQHAAYYPFSLLFLVLPLSKAYGWYTVSQLWLAGVLMYAFGRILGMRRASAFLAGLVYQGSGFMLTSAAVFPMIIGAAAWLPLLLACIEKIIQTATERSGRTLLWAAAGAVALGLQILGGHIEITYYTLLIMAAYAAWRVASRLWQAASNDTSHITPHASRFTFHVSRFTLHASRPAAWLVSMVLLGLMLGAVQLFPFYEIGQANFREGSASFTEVQGWAFPKRRILALALPNFFGNPTHHTYIDALNGQIVPFDLNYYGQPNPRGAYTSDWGIKNYVEGGIYVGILPLFLVLPGLYAAWRRRSDGRRVHTAFFLTLSAFSLAFIFGTPLYALLYYGLPFINQLHTPFRWVFPLSLCLAALAGFGADYVETGGQRSRKSPRSTLYAAFFLWGRPSLITGLAGVAFWSGLLLLSTLAASRAFYHQLEPLIERVFLGLAQAPDAFAGARAFYSYQFWQVLVLGLLLVATGTVLRLSRHEVFSRRRPIWAVMAAGVIVLDLFLANYGFNAAVDPALLAHRPDMVQWLAQQPGLWRLTSYNPHGDKPFNANSAWLFDFQDVRGYDSIIPRQYTQYMATIEPQNELQFNRVQPIANRQSLNSPLLDVLGVRYVVSSEIIDLPKFQPAWEGEGVRVYENLAAAPRAYSLSQGSTVLVDDALAALTVYDPRQHVVVESGDWKSEIGGISNFQSPMPDSLVPAEIDSYGNIEVIVSAAPVEPAWLILNDSYFPGWRAYVRPFSSGDEAESQVDIYRVNGNFRGILLEPGHWTVRFRYSPLSFQLGALGSFMAGIILLFALGVWAWRALVRPDVALTTTRSLARNSLAPMTLNLFNKFIDFAFAAFYLRVLGPADAGSFASAIATAGFFDILANFGLNILLIREVSQDRSQASRYLLNTSILRLGTSLVASLPILVFILATGRVGTPLPANEIAAIILIMAGMVFSSLAQGVTGLFYVYEKAEVPAAMTTVTTIFRVGLGVAALLLGTGFVGLAAVSIVVNIITLLILATLALRSLDLPGPWQVDFRLQRQMVQRGYPLMLIHLLQTIFISIDVVLLRQISTERVLFLQQVSSEEVVGWYSSAYKWFNALQIVPSFFTLALFPIISREIKQSLPSAQRMYQMSLKLMLLLALPVAAVTFFLAYPLVQIVGGEEFLPHGAVALQIVIWSIPIGWLNSVTNYVLIALGLERMQPRAFAVAVGFNIIANLIFIPYFSYVAASVTTILSEVVLLIVFAYYLRRRMPGLNWGRLLGRPLAVTAVMLAAMWAGSQINTAVGLALGLLVYPAGLWLLRVVGAEERHILRSILPARIATRLKLV